MQPDFSIPLLKRCKARGITTVLDTCGFAPTEVVEQAVKHTDLVLLDIKHMDPEQHRRGTGKDNGAILKNAIYMARTTKVRISLPLIPGFNDGEHNLCETAAFALALDVSHVDLNPMHSLGTDKYRSLGMEPPYADLRQPTPEETRKALEIIESYGLSTTVGRMM
jgi:pyruvate formate lyase activating enzyme